MKQSEKMSRTTEFLYCLGFSSSGFSIRHAYFISVVATEAMFFLKTAIKWQDELLVQTT